MSCFEQIYLTTQMIPVPAASPIFIALFAISLVYSIRPCFYCIIMMAIFYVLTSPSSPFSATRSTTQDIANTTIPRPDPALAYNDPLPDRGWFNWNDGRMFDPPLVGFLPSTSGTAAPSPQAIIERQAVDGLPAGYIDLRWTGLQLVVDLNWRRTEEGMKWEGHTGEITKPVERTKEAEPPVEDQEGDDSLAKGGKIDVPSAWSLRGLSAKGKELGQATQEKLASIWSSQAFAKKMASPFVGDL